MSKVLLTSAGYIKANSELLDNYEESKLLPAIRKCQDIELTEALGSSFVGKLCALVESDDIKKDENKLVKELLDDYIRPYLLYLVLGEVCFVGGQKITNYGIAVSTDEHLESLKLADRMQVKDYYRNIASDYLNRMQRFIIGNHSSLTEIMKCDDTLKIHPNLSSSADTGIFLGGKRNPGKRY